jgi:cyclopropane-fatty-acyl-phospholipid synthase
MSDVSNAGFKAARLHSLSERRDALILAACARALRPATRGALTVRLPSGFTRTFGTGGGVEADLELRSFSVLSQALRRGSIGFGEAYMAGDVESSNLVDVFRFYLDNKSAMDRAWGGAFRVRLPDRVVHRLRSNTRRGSRRNIRAHYDLGNTFYRLWLDRSMTYSSAIYATRDETLEAAQQEKLSRIADALRLDSASRVLEIGCGWGALAQHLARRGAHVTAITVSAEQLAWAEHQIREAGLTSRVDMRFCDYRDVAGTYDRIVSIEMIEAVGEAHWPAYFATLRDRLAPGGEAIVQAITIAPDLFERYRRKVDFIQRYIFPGGMLPTEATMAASAGEAGLTFERVETFGQSYAWTLADWRMRFEAAWPEIARMGFDERFRRMWHYYLTYCEAGFERGAIDVGLYRFKKPQI